MDKHNQGGRAGDAGEPNDTEPFDELYRQLRDRFVADAMGMSSKGRLGDDLMQAYGAYTEEMVRVFTSAATSMASERRAFSPGAAGGTGDTQGDVMAAMADAYLAWMTRGVRYWSRLGERQGSFQASMVKRLLAMRSDPEHAEDEQRALVDEAEAHLRGLADLTMQEARAFQTDLEAIGRSCRDAMAGEETLDSPRRFARAKS